MRTLARAPGVIAVMIVAATAAAPAAGVAAPPDSTALGHALDHAVAPLVRGGELSGQLIVARDGRILVERCWGAAHRDRHTPMLPTTRMCIASITKPVNQVVAIKLLVAGKISAGDTIGRFLPGFPHGRITVEQLMRHTSGIPHRVTKEEDERRPLTPWNGVRTRALPLAGPKRTFHEAGRTRGSIRVASTA